MTGIEIIGATIVFLLILGLLFGTEPGQLIGGLICGIFVIYCARLFSSEELYLGKRHSNRYI